MAHVDREKLAYFLSKLQTWVASYAPSKDVATSYSPGLMSAADKAKLDGLQIDAALNASSVNPVQNRAIAQAMQDQGDRISALEASSSATYTYKGSVPTYADLPSSGNQAGDVYDVLTPPDDGSWAWNGTSWNKLSGFVDLSALATKDVATASSDGLMSASDKAALDMLMQGFVPLWSSLEDYQAGSLIRGSDGVLYASKQASGPGTSAGARNPASGSAGAYWAALPDAADLFRLDGDQTVDGVKTFLQPIAGSVTGSASYADEAGAPAAWSASKDYAAGSLVRGSDSKVYVASAASGPNAGGADNPVSGTGAKWAPLLSGGGDFVHISGAETVSGKKTFSQPVVADVELAASGAPARRLLSDRLSERITPLDFGAKGDGATNDSQAFAALEAARPGAWVDCLGKTYLVSSLPSGAEYVNGAFLYGGKTYLTEYGELRSGTFGVAIGPGAGASVPNVYREALDLIAIGREAARDLVTTSNCIAIGQRALAGPAPGRWNIAIGVESLFSVESPEPGNSNNMAGTRNICIGGNAGHFITTGNRNIIIGRDVGHAVKEGGLNVFIGGGSVGDCPNTPVELTVVNQKPLSPWSSVCVGTSSLMHYGASSAVAVGAEAFQYLQSATGSIAIGRRAGQMLGSDVSPFGFAQTIVDIDGTFVQTGTSSVTVQTDSPHGLVAGGMVRLRFTSGTLSSVSAADDIWFNVASVSGANQFTIASYPADEGTLSIPPRTDSGGVHISMTASAAAAAESAEGNVIIGYNACSEAARCMHATIVGHRAGIHGGDYAVYVGHQAGGSATGIENVFVGWRSGNAVTTGQSNVAVGTLSLDGCTTGSYNVALGSSALRLDYAGGDFNYSGCVGLGSVTRCSGDNQVQLGNAAQTAYVYGAVQTRSDARDKADVRATGLGLDFVRRLRPVDFRWDRRDDYVDFDGENVVSVPKDGSRRRVRFHHGFLAQDVKQAMDALGIDFGGYQDHSHNGGGDVLTLGYEEFIAPIVKAVQELDARLAALEA